MKKDARATTATTHITFDDRETDLVEAFRVRTADRPDVHMTVERLAMGDVVIRSSPQSAADDDGHGASSTAAAEGGPPTVIVVERKKVADLMASLFDGRLAEQCHRMRTWQAEQEGIGPVVWTVVAVEGVATPLVWGGSPDPDARFRHFAKLLLQLHLDAAPAERRFVIRTSSTQETAALLLTLQKTIRSSGPGSPASPVYGRTTPLPRKTQSDPFLRQLCATQGMSYQRALRVRERWSDCAALCDALRGAEGGAVLADLGRRMGSPCVARRLCEDLLGEAGRVLSVPAPPPPAAAKKRRLTAAAAAGPPPPKRAAKPRKAVTAAPVSSPPSPRSHHQRVVLVGQERGDEDVGGGEGDQQPDHAGLPAAGAELGGEHGHAGHRHEEHDDLPGHSAAPAPRI